MQISYAENQMGNRGSVAHSPNLDISVDCFHAHFAFKIACLYSESMGTELPQIETKSYHYGQLRMNAWKIARNYCIKSAYNG